MYSSDEMMAVAGSRQITNGQVCFVGIGLPGRAALLAKHLDAPKAVLVYESGILDPLPKTAPLSIGDGSLAETARAIVSMPEIFNYWLQGGHIDLGFLGAAQIDRYGNINTTVIGSYETPRVRLPGAGGAPEIANSASEVVVILKHRPEALVEKVDFITSLGHGDGTGVREALSLRGGGPQRIVTDLGILSADPTSHEFVLTGIYPGIEVATVKERTGWDLKVAEDLELIEEPTLEELDTLRAIDGR